MLGIWIETFEGAEDWLRDGNGQPVVFENEADKAIIALSNGAIKYREWEAREIEI